MNGLGDFSRRSLMRAGIGVAALPFLASLAHAAAAEDGTITVGTIVGINNFDPYNQSVNALLMLKVVNA